MVLTDTRRAKLVESFRGNQEIHEVAFDMGFWEGHVLPQLGAGVDALLQRLGWSAMASI